MYKYVQYSKNYHFRHFRETITLVNTKNKMHHITQSYTDK